MAALNEEYLAEEEKAGGKRMFRAAQNRAMARDLGVFDEQRSCIAFLIARGEVPVILPMPPQAWRTEHGAVAVWKVLERSFSPAVLETQIPGFGTRTPREMRADLERHCRRVLAELVGQQGPALVYTPPGTKWESVGLIVGPRTLTIDVDGTQRSLDVEGAGFINRRTRKPDQVWTLLRALGARCGVLECADLRGIRGKSPKHGISKLRARLKQLLALAGDPIECLADPLRYRCRFRIRATDIITISVPPGTQWDAILISEIQEGILSIRTPSLTRTPYRSGSTDDDDEQVDWAERESTVTNQYDYAMLSLTTSSGNHTAEGKLLTQVLRSEGKLRRASAAGVEKLSRILKRSFGIETPPFEYSERSGILSANFEASSEVAR